MPEIEEAVPKYLQIAGHIRDQIVRGDYVAGAEIPSERQLAASWKVARPTAARALETLRRQGFVESRQGSGTFVRSANAAPRARERYERARDLGTMYSDTESIEFLAVEIVPAPEHVAAALELPDGSEAIRRSRLLRGAEGKPIELSTSWFRPDLAKSAPLLLEPERLRGGTGKYIAETTGQASSYARDQVAARTATDDESRLLELSEGAPVLVYRLTVYDESDGPVQTDDAIYPPGAWAFRQEYALPPL